MVRSASSTVGNGNIWKRKRKDATSTGKSDSNQNFCKTEKHTSWTKFYTTIFTSHKIVNWSFILMDLNGKTYWKFKYQKYSVKSKGFMLNVQILNQCNGSNNWLHKILIIYKRIFHLSDHSRSTLNGKGSIIEWKENPNVFFLFSRLMKKNNAIKKSLSLSTIFFFLLHLSEHFLHFWCAIWYVWSVSVNRVHYVHLDLDCSVFYM